LTVTLENFGPISLTRGDVLCIC